MGVLAWENILRGRHRAQADIQGDRAALVFESIEGYRNARDRSGTSANTTCPAT